MVLAYSARGRAGLALVLGSAVAALLTGCSSHPAVTTAAPTSSPTTVTSPAGSGTTTASTSGRQSAQPVGDGTGNGTPGPGGASDAVSAGCRNLFVTAQVKAEITKAQVAYSHLTHIEPVPGDFFYGSCGATGYAATDFQPAVGAGDAEGVGLQDDGSVMQYYAQTAGGGWQHLAADRFPRDARGCAAIHQIPAALAALWHGCPTAPRGAPLTYLAGTGWSARSPVYRPAAVVLSGDSTLGLQGMSWSSWSMDGGSGSGTGWVDDCKPDCASGKIVRAPVQVVLSGNDYTCGREFYTRLVIIWTAAVPPGMTRNFTWKSGTPVC